MRRKTLLGLGMAILIVALLFNVLAPKPVVKRDLPTEFKIYNDVAVTVRRANGTVETYRVGGDPWLRNFFTLITNAFFGRYYVSAYSIYRTDGSTFTQPEWEYITTTGNRPYLRIGLGRGNTPVTLYDYELITPIVKVDVTSANTAASNNGTHIVMSFTASYTFSSSDTVREVGLYWRGYAFGSSTLFDVLIAREVLPTPISVQANDAVSVTYQVAIKYSNPPMILNLAVLICNYIFGLAYYGRAFTYATTDGTSTSVMDIGQDYTGNADNIKEYAYLRIGSGDPIYRRDITNLYSYVAESASSLTIGLSFNTTHAIIQLPAASVTVTSSVVIKEVGLVIKSTDIDGGATTTSKDVLILYFPLTNYVYVPAGSGVKFNFILAFPLYPTITQG